MRPKHGITIFREKKIPKSVQIENINEDSRKANICQYELRR